MRDVIDAGVERIRLDFFDEDYSKTLEVIELYKRGIVGDRVDSMEENTFTRGHFYRGVF